MIPGPEVVENKFSDAKRASTSTSNSNITNGVAGVPIIVDEAPEVVIYE